MSTLPASLRLALAVYQDDRSNAAEARVVSEIEAYAASQVAAERERWQKLCDENSAACMHEIARLQGVLGDTRTQRDELLAHLAGKAQLPQWAAEWLQT